MTQEVNESLPMTVSFTFDQSKSNLYSSGQRRFQKAERYAATATDKIDSIDNFDAILADYQLRAMNYSGQD